MGISIQGSTVTIWDYKLLIYFQADCKIYWEDGKCLEVIITNREGDYINEENLSIDELIAIINHNAPDIEKDLQLTVERD